MMTKQVRRYTLAAIVACFLPLASMRSQTAPPPPQPSAPDAASAESTREQLLTLLRVSPTLTAVLASDPSLLANQDYIAKANPELGKLLAQHPEVARSPDFYLFADIHSRCPNRVEALQRRVWTGEAEPERNDSAYRIVDQIVPMLVGFAVIGAFAWLIKVLLINRRWNRVFRLQTEVHGKLIDRFGSSQEVLTYMQTDAGKRFLEAGPISVEMQQGEERWPAVLQRILMPLTAGIVLTLLGAGLLMMRHSVSGGETALLLFGIVALMPGLGCIIAATITWFLAQRLGLMPTATRNEQ